MNKVQLERIAHEIYLKLSAELVGEYVNQLDVGVSPIPEGDFVMRVTTRAFGRLLDRKTVKYPATWRDAFKLEVLPHWLRKRLKIDYIVKTLASRVAYPEIDIKGQKRVIYYDIENT